MLFIPYTQKSFLQDIIKIAQILQEYGKPRLRVVQKEEDNSSTASGAGTFFKLDNTRLGRDFEIYALMGELYQPGIVLAEIASIGMVLNATGLGETIDRARDEFKGLAKYLNNGDQQHRWTHIWREKGFDEYKNFNRDIVLSDGLGHVGMRPGDKL